MRSSLLFAALGGCGALARASSTSGFVAPHDCRGRRASGTVAVVVGGGARATAAATTATTTTTRLLSMPEPIASEGDWSAYLDSESTGYVYYFNGVTGESTWEPPTPTFPPVVGASTAAKSATTTTTYAATTATAAAASVTAVKEDRRTERQRRREQKKAELAAASSSSGSGGGGGGGLFGFFGGGGSREAATTAKTQAQQLSDLREIANNDEFLSDLDAVIAEAEEAIAIASRVEEAPPKNKGGFFSSLGFVSGSEAVEEVESLITDAERTLEGVFSGLSLGARKSPKEKEKAREKVAAREGPPPPSPTPAAEENVWVESLMSLFKNTFDAFIPPPLTTNEMTMSKSTSTSTSTSSEKTIKNKKVVVAAIETPEKERKAKVSDSDFLDVIWGAETSARPTLNIKEMMKAFQVRSTEEERPAAEKASEFRTLSLEAALEVRAHPEKVSWGGEDAGFFVGRTFGVFDGVSGAAKEKGKKLYSRCLADTMKKSVTGAGKAVAAGVGGSGLSVRQITDYLLEAKKLADGEGTGASTAVVASIGEDNVLRALNLGDSVCLVLRDGAVAARTREIVHYFDCPYQLGDDSPDRPSDGTTLQAEIFGGDVIVAGSDGVFDNLSDADVCEIVSSFGARGKSSAIAKKIVDRSRTVSLDPESVTPYSTVARGKSGYGAYKNGKGGKVDDISCLVVKAS